MRERVESFSSMISKRTTFKSVNDSSSFTSIPDVIEESEVWMRGPISKLPSLSEPVPSDWEVIEGYYLYFKPFNSAIDYTFYSIASCIFIYLLNTLSVINFVFKNIIYSTAGL